MSARPAITVILGGDAPAAGRRRCRDALIAHAARAGRVEIIEVDARGPLGRRHNAAVDQASAPLILIWDAGWQPLPALFGYLREQHQRHDASGDAVLIHAEAGVELRNVPLVRWWLSRGGWPRRPETHGVYGWTHFRAPGLSVRKDLFRHARFDETFASGDEAELAARLTSLVPVRVWFDRFPLATVEAAPTTAAALHQAYLDGYFRRLRWQRVPGVRDVADLDAVHLEPERFARTEAARGELWTALTGLEGSFEGAELSFLDKAQTDRLQVLFETYEMAFSAATAAGHLHALAGEPPAPPVRRAFAQAEAPSRRTPARPARSRARRARP